MIPQTLEALRAALVHAEQHAARCDVGAMEALTKWSDAETSLPHGGRMVRDGVTTKVDAARVAQLWRLYSGERDNAARAHAAAGEIAQRIAEQERTESRECRLMAAAGERDQLAADALRRLNEAEERDHAERTKSGRHDGAEESAECQIRRKEYNDAHEASQRAQAALRENSDANEAPPAWEWDARRVSVQMTRAQLNGLLAHVGTRCDSLHASQVALQLIPPSHTAHAGTRGRLAGLTTSVTFWTGIEAALKTAEVETSEARETVRDVLRVLDQIATVAHDITPRTVKVSALQELTRDAAGMLRQLLPPVAPAAGESSEGAQ